jgi:flavin reductase (DIM6/NTAB) family NADH-FMN oxidoreductase RutF
MTIDQQTFAAVMSTFPTGVAVITTVDGDGEPWGLTSNAVCSVSADPPSLLVCISKTSRTLPALLERRGFLVNFMATDSAEVCSLFASRATSATKFREVEWELSPFGHPHLHDASVAFADCETVEEHQVGTHLIIVGRILEAGVTNPDRDPVVYFRRSYRAVEIDETESHG